LGLSCSVENRFNPAGSRLENMSQGETSVLNLSLSRVKRGTVATAVIASALGGFVAPAAFTSAAALTCASATPSAVAAAPSTGTPLPSEPIPTQAAVPAEQNPPGDIPDNQAFVAYISTDGGYSIQMPEGWARTEDGANVRFADKLHTFSVDATCLGTAPTVDSVTNVEVPALTQQVPAFELIDVKAVDLPAGPAILVRYYANSAPDEVTGKQYRLEVERYELWKDGKLAAITLAVPAGSDNVDVANLVTKSFRWTT
jgi:hypothetical protein